MKAMMLTLAALTNCGIPLAIIACQSTFSRSKQQSGSRRQETGLGFVFRDCKYSDEQAWPVTCMRVSLVVEMTSSCTATFAVPSENLEFGHGQLGVKPSQPFGP